jgi:hypothetical protein
MKKAFEAIWEHGQIVPIESIKINDHTQLSVVILDEQKSDNPSFIQEARRQSLLVSRQDHAESDI